MKILFFASSFGTGVTVLMTEHICALVKQPGVELLAIAGPGAQESGLKKRILEAGGSLHRIAGLDEHHEMNRLIRELSQTISNFSPDIIMVQTNWQLVMTRLAKWKCHSTSKLIYWIHGYRNSNVWKSKIALPVIGLLLRFCTDRAIASSKIVLNKFSPWAGKKKMRFLPLGVDQVFFNAKQEKKNDPPPMKLVFAGQFRQGKQQDWIVRAVARCRQAGYAIEAVLPGDGPLRRKIMQLADDLGVADIVHFPGNITRKDLIHWYHDATLGVVTSNNETFGSCIAEPMVCGLPLLTRPVGCAIDLIEEGRNGFLFSTEEELFSQLRKIMDDSGLYQRVRSNANQSASYFDWNRICKEEISVFNELL